MSTRGSIAMSASRGNELGADALHDLGQRPNVVLGRPEVDDARAQEIGAVDDRVRDEDLSAPLQALEELLVQAVDLVTVDSRRTKPEGRDAQVRRASLELRIGVAELVQELCQAAVLGDRLDVAAPPRLSHGEPDLERPEPARVLRPALVVVQR